MRRLSLEGGGPSGGAVGLRMTASRLGSHAVQAEGWAATELLLLLSRGRWPPLWC